MKAKIGRHLFILLPILVLVNIIVDFAFNHDDIEFKTVVSKTVPLILIVVFSTFNILIKKSSVHSIVFIIASCSTALLSTQSELSSAIFLVFALYKQPKISWHWYYIPAVFVCIVINFLSRGIAINFFFNYIIFYSGIIIFYYVDIHHREIFFLSDEKIDSQTIRVLYEMVQGYTVKEICYRSGRTYDAISKSLERARNTLGGQSNNYTLIAYCVKNRLFDKEFDNWPIDDL